MGRPWNPNVHYHHVIHASLREGASRVLDVGCGDGLLSMELANAGIAQVVALDLDDDVLARARAAHHAPAISWVRADVLDAPFQPASFDAVVSVATLHHMDASRALRRFAELVRPGGTVAVVGLAANSPAGLALAAIGLAAATAIGVVRRRWNHTAPMCWPPPLTYREVQAVAAEVLPGSRYRRHLLNRFSIVWRKPARPSGET